MGAQTPGNMTRTIGVSNTQTQPNAGSAQPQMRARQGFQQTGPAFERLMQDQAFRQRATQEQIRRGSAGGPSGFGF